MVQLSKRSVLMGRLWMVLLAFAIAGSWGCGGTSASASSSAPTPTPTPTPGPSPTPTPVPSNVLELKVLDTSVPASGIFQFQLSLTEPKPIGHGSTRPNVPSGPVRGVSVNDPSGQAVGIAVVNNTTGIQIQLASPNGQVPTFGTDPNYPIVTLSMDLSQVAPAMNPGDTSTISIDPNPQFFPDASNQVYPKITTAAGTLTIAPAGSPGVTDVIPGGGSLPNGTVIKVLGVGFTSNTRVSIEDTNIVTQTFINSGEIDVKICTAAGLADGATTCPAADGVGPTFQLDGERVRVKDQNNNVNEYYSYLRADDASATPSNTALIGEVHPMFSHQLYTTATIPLVNTTTQFTGVSVQNTSGLLSTIVITLTDDNGTNLGSVQFQLADRKKSTRDVIADFFSGAVPVGATKIKVTSTQPVQVLGMLGDTSSGTVTPVIPQ
jgi:hypothetical protein